MAFCNSESLIKKVHAFFVEIFGANKPRKKGIFKALLEAWSGPWFAVLVKNNASGQPPNTAPTTVLMKDCFLSATYLRF
jgi:hypothetical protein